MQDLRPDRGRHEMKGNRSIGSVVTLFLVLLHALPAYSFLKLQTPSRLDLEAAIPYAYLSAEIYECDDRCRELTGWNQIWRPVLDSRDWIKEWTEKPGEPFGFRAVAYTTLNKEQLAIVYEGTDILSIKDWITDVSPSETISTRSEVCKNSDGS